LFWLSGKPKVNYSNLPYCPYTERCEQAEKTLR